MADQSFPFHQGSQFNPDVKKGLTFISLLSVVDYLSRFQDHDFNSFSIIIPCFAMLSCIQPHLFVLVINPEPNYFINNYNQNVSDNERI